MGNKSALIKLILTKDGLAHWRIYVSLGHQISTSPALGEGNLQATGNSYPGMTA